MRRFMCLFFCVFYVSLHISIYLTLSTCFLIYLFIYLLVCLFIYFFISLVIFPFHMRLHMPLSLHQVSRVLLLTPQVTRPWGSVYTQIQDVASLLSHALSSSTEPVPDAATDAAATDAAATPLHLQGAGLLRGCKRVRVYLHAACHGSIIARGVLANDSRIWQNQVSLVSADHATTAYTSVATAACDSAATLASASTATGTTLHAAPASTLFQCALLLHDETAANFLDSACVPAFAATNAVGAYSSSSRCGCC